MSNMIKFVVFGVFLWQQVVTDHFGQAYVGVDTKPSGFPVNIPSASNDSSKGLTLEKNGHYNFHASQQIFYLQGPLAWKTPTGLTNSLHDVGRELGFDYKVTNGIGAHKFHMRRLAWNRARRVCVEEGGHLAVIRTESEEKIILQMMTEDWIVDAWIGYHDKFEEGDWVTVLDEPLAQTGWARWSKKYTPNPDNYDDKQHCACLGKNAGGMHDLPCESELPFICKISIH